MALGRFILIPLFLCTLSFAEIFDHLKKVEGKSDHHTMRNIDFIYMINLDERPEKYAHASAQLHHYGIYPYRFSAVNGWNLSVETINDLGIKYQRGMLPMLSTSFPFELGGTPHYGLMTKIGVNYFCYTMPLGALGCALSHLSVLKDAWDSGYETIWVLEDDIDVLFDPHYLPGLIDELDALVGKENWDVLFTDCDWRHGPNHYNTCYGAPYRPDMDCREQVRFHERYTVKKNISRNLRKISSRYGTHSMIIRRSGIQKLLEFFQVHKIFWGYDVDAYLPLTIQRYSLTYDLISNLIGSHSDNGAPNYLKQP